MLLAGQPGIEVVGEVADGRAAVTAVDRLRPDVVIMDLGMPEMNGVEATRVICRDFPGTQVLVLSMYSGEEYVRPAIRAGASGYLLKGSAFSELLAAIAAVARGGASSAPRSPSSCSSTRGGARPILPTPSPTGSARSSGSSSRASRATRSRGTSASA
ncbi:response regulator [Nannocystis pusilla]|uniref:response regulator n=1 Tax=Nannocystis pusilla TaxID=889268 RepID=UPI003B8266E4